MSDTDSERGESMPNHGTENGAELLNAILGLVGPGDEDEEKDEGDGAEETALKRACAHTTI